MIGHTLARVAARNVFRNRRRSLITAAAISFGLTCLLVFQALKVGLHEEFVSSVTRTDAGSLEVHAAGYEANLAAFLPLKEPQRIAEAFAEAGVERVAPRLRAHALVLAGSGSSTVVLSGVDPAAERRLTIIAGRVVAGRYVSPGGGVLVGEALAKALRLGIGDEITLLLQGVEGRPLARRFRLEGVYRTGLGSFERTHAYLALPDAQRAVGAPGALTEYAARVPPGSEAALAARLRARLPEYQVRTWRELAPDLVQIIELNDATLRFLVLIVFAIVALGIANTMMMATFERVRELGVLAAIGSTPGTLFTMILLEAVTLGGIACAVGSAAGLALCSYFAHQGIDLARLTSANPYFTVSHTIHAHLLARDFVVANALTLVTAAVAGLLPAVRASRLEPAEAVRHA